MGLTSWNQYTIKTQLLCSQGSIVTLSLLIIWAILISYVFVVSQNIVGELRENLKGDIIKNTQFLATDNSNLFVAIMNKNTNGFVNPYLYYAQICQEPTFNLQKIRGYFEYGNDFLPQPLTFDYRHNKYVSFASSSFKVPYLQPFNETNLNPSIISIINYTMHVDEIAIPSYQNYLDFVSIYSGFENSGLFLKYPGIETLSTDPNRTYDPRRRGWYNRAVTANNVIYTDPYQDFNSKRWMITIAKPIILNDQIIGVVGGDMLIDTIKQNIERIKILDSGKATLFTSTGIVIADKEWLADVNSNIYTFRDLENPEINDETWNLLTSSTTDFGIYTNGNYKIVVNRIQLEKQYYYLMLTIPDNKITEPLNNIINNIETSKTSSLIIISVVTIGVIVVTILITIYISNSISESIKALCESSDKIIKNLGKDDIMVDVNSVKNNTGYLEVNRMEEQYNNMLEQLRRQPNGPEANQYYHNPFYFGYPAQQQIVPIPEVVVGKIAVQ
jgi:hypothetical protein